MSETPETDALWENGWNHTELFRLSRKLERERDELRAAVRNLRDVKGRYNTQQATERLFAMLPESNFPA